MNSASDPEVRKSGIGGSDAAVILGLSDYKSPYELWLEKRGQLAPADLSDNASVHWGIRLESAIADEYAERHQVKLRNVNATRRLKDADFVMAHIDRDIVGEKRGLEVKTTSRFALGDQWGAPGTDQVPDGYLVQCQHYMLVYGYPVWDLAVLIDGREYRDYRIPFDRGLADDLLAAEAEFWAAVQSGEQPEFDMDSKRALDVMQRLYTGSDGSRIEADGDIEAWNQIRIQATAEIKSYEGVRDGALAHMLRYMKSAAILGFKDGSELRRAMRKRGAYSVEATEYLHTQFYPAKKGEK